MATTYPATKQTFSDPAGTNTQDSPDHAGLHTNINDTVEELQDTVGTTGGTNVLKSFVAGDIPVRSDTSNVLQTNVSGTMDVLAGTFDNGVFGTPAITSGTVDNVVVGTPAIVGGTYDDAVLGTPAITGGTIDNAVIGTSAITGGTIILDNNVAYQARDSGDGNDVDLINLNGSDQTVIGSAGVRATRYVPLTNYVEVTPGTLSTSFADIDCTSATSANTFAINFLLVYNSGTAGMDLEVRPNGGTSSGHLRARIQIVNLPIMGGGICGCDSSQIIEYLVDDATGTANLRVIGYHEYVD